MWVRIRELSFPTEHADRVVAHVRDTTVTRFGAGSYRGSRLLLDRDGGTALEVSYWQDEDGARGRDDAGGGPQVDATGVPGGATGRVTCYELAVDAG